MLNRLSAGVRIPQNGGVPQNVFAMLIAAGLTSQQLINAKRITFISEGDPIQGLGAQISTQFHPGPVYKPLMAMGRGTTLGPFDCTGIGIFRLFIAIPNGPGPLPADNGVRVAVESSITPIIYSKRLVEGQ